MIYKDSYNFTVNWNIHEVRFIASRVERHFTIFPNIKCFATICCFIIFDNMVHFIPRQKTAHFIIYLIFCEGAKAQTEWQVYYQLIVHFIPWQNKCHILLFTFLLFNLVLVKLNGSHLLVICEVVIFFYNYI